MYTYYAQIDERNWYRSLIYGTRSKNMSGYDDVKYGRTGSVEVTSEQKKLIAKNAIKTLAWERTYR